MYKNLRECEHYKDYCSTYIVLDRISELTFIICDRCYLEPNSKFRRMKGFEIISKPIAPLTKIEQKKEQLKVPF